MDIYQASQDLRQFVLSHGLPHTDVAMVGIRCPYCGKSEHIRCLEHPLEIGDLLSKEEKDHYSTLFDRLVKGNEALGVCKFCQNPVRLADGIRPEPFEE